MNLEQKILKHLLLDEEYTRKTLPFIKGEYFQESSEKLLFDEIQTTIAGGLWGAYLMTVAHFCKELAS